MKNHVEQQLSTAGWFPGRHVDVTPDTAELKRQGFPIWDDLLALLSEYTGLTIRSNEGTRELRIDGARAAAGVDPAWAEAYSEALGTVLSPIAESSHMTIYLSQSAQFYGGFDGEYGHLASNVKALVDRVVNRNPPGRFDRTLD